MVQEPISAFDRLERGRAAFRKQQWGTAYSELVEADHEAPLEPEDLDLLAAIADLTGHGKECVDYWTRAHDGFVARGDISRAFHCAYWIGMCLLFQGEAAPANGWFAKAQRLLDEAAMDGVERGYLLISRALQAEWSGNLASSHALFDEAARLAKRYQEPDLNVMSAIGLGETCVRLGEGARGIALLDEAMATVMTAEVSPLVVGLTYCAVLSACQDFFETRRAQEWTRAFTRWCEAQQDLVPYRGDCLVYRAELMQLSDVGTIASGKSG